MERGEGEEKGFMKLFILTMLGLNMNILACIQFLTEGRIKQIKDVCAKNNKLVSNKSA